MKIRYLIFKSYYALSLWSTVDGQERRPRWTINCRPWTICNALVADILCYFVAEQIEFIDFCSIKTYVCLHQENLLQFPINSTY